MSYACDICNKGRHFGQNVPFSQKRTNKVWKPNLQRQRVEIGGTSLQVKICTQCLRTIKKKAAEKAAEKTEKETAKAKA